MVDHLSNSRQANVYSIDSSLSSRNLGSPRTIEELLRQKYTGHSSISRENSFSLTLNSPAAQLEQVLANSRFARLKKEPQSSTPRFQPKHVEVSIKDLEKKLQEKDPPKYALPTKQSLELIQRLREEVRNRSGLLEPEEPPDLFDMNVIDRNEVWLANRQLKIDRERQARKDRELDGCTFRPIVNTPRLRTPSSVRSKSPNTSYSQQYARRKNYRSLSTGKISGRGKDYLQIKLSPTDRNYSYKAGINLNSFLMRAQPVVDYRCFNK